MKRSYTITIGEATVAEFDTRRGTFTAIKTGCPLEAAKNFIKTFKIGEIFEVTLTPVSAPSLNESDWTLQLREIFDAKVSIPFDSFEVDWKSLYQSGWTPEEAAESAIEELEGK